MSFLSRYFLLEKVPQTFVSGDYNLPIVFLSIFISIFASWISLYMLNRYSKLEQSFYKWLIQFTASLSLGGAVWSMHFIGMLSFELCTKVEYNTTLTILSLLPSFLASFVALFYLNKERIESKELVFVGVIVGSGIGIMHYTGMAAMEMSPQLMYDPILFLTSLFVAVSLAIVSIYFHFRLKKTKIKIRNSIQTLISGIVMGSAISGMHYTGMAAARFVSTEGDVLISSNPDQWILAIIVGIGTFVVIGSVLAVNAFISYKSLFETLQRSESRLRAIIETAADSIVIISIQGIIKEFNVSAERMFGYKSEEIIGKNIKILMPDPFRSEHDSYLENYLNTGITKIIGQGREARAIKKDGTIFPVRLAVGHAKLPQDDVFVGFISDLTERVKIEEALKENEEQMKSFIQNIPGVVYRCLADKDWTTVFMSDSAYHLTGYLPHEFMHPNRIITFNDLIHPEDRTHVSNMIQNAIDTSDTFVLNYRIINKSGDIRWVLEYGGPVFDENKQVKFLDGVLLDNTDRRLIEEALIESKEKAEMAAITKTTFLANMSHEIRTPMNAIIGFTEVLLSGDLIQNQKSHLETIRGSAKSLLRLLNDILNSAKLDKGAVELEYLDFSLIALIDQVCSTLKIEAKKKGLQLTTDVSSDLEEYYKGDSLRIRQILLNLIGNAIKFTKVGSIRISVSSSDGNVLFTIQDTGIGIPKDRLGKIFDPFTQADVSMSRRFGGTGLGTTISKQLVELMNGKIWVESEMNKGSFFYVELPLPKGSPVIELSESMLLNLPALSVLIADDVPQNVELISVLMKNQGNHITIARNGLEAVQAFQKSRFDFILMDIQMPDMDGIEATKQIRLLETSAKKTPIIALSASVFEEDKKAAFASGMNGFVSKPIDVQELFGEIYKVMGIDPFSGKKEYASEETNSFFAMERGKLLFGSYEKYHAVLDGFLSDLQKEMHDFSEGKLSKEEEAKFLHKAKGSSGNLGILPFEKMAASLEEKLKSNSLSSDDRKSFSIIFDSLLEELTILKNPSESSETRKETITLSKDDLERIRNYMDELKVSFTKNSVNQSALARISEILKNSIYEGLFNQMTDTIRSFDFERTLEVLDELQNKLLGIENAKQ